MTLKFSIILSQYLIFSSRNDFALTKALIGENVLIADSENLKFVVSLIHFSNRNSFLENDHECTGSLITNRHVLTADHGLTILQQTGFEVIIGSFDIREGRRYIPSWWINYMQWSTANRICVQNEVNDIAIIRLSENVPDHINPVELYPMAASHLYGANVQIAGWGLTYEGQISRNMNTAYLKVLIKSECERRTELLSGVKGYFPDNIICSAADPFVLTTGGNSGGPLLFNNKLVAIHLSVGPDLETFHPGQINLHLSIEGFVNYIETVSRIP